MGCLAVKSLSCAALFLLAARSGSAAIVYDFTLPANGNVDAIHVQLTFPRYPIGSLDNFTPDDPEFTFYSSGTSDLPFPLIGVTIAPSLTLIGVALSDGFGNIALVNHEFPNDLFWFNRVPNQNGVFLSVSGRLDATPPFMLETTTPTAQLVVSGDPVPEPASVFTFVMGAAVLGLLRSRRQS
jgi:hypothetical protein